MLFSDLSPLVNSCSSITIAIAAGSDGTVNVTVIPKAKYGQNAVLSTPLSLTGTLAELDAEFAQLVMGFTSKRATLAEQLEATNVILEAAKQDAAKSATRKKPSKTAKDESEQSNGDDDELENVSNNKKSQTSETPEVKVPASILVDDLWA